ncbi:MAG: glycosyltransferase [Treponema sp.]|nr:glycosyltransferase [Treponema sp.]
MILNEQHGSIVYSDGNETEKRMLEIARKYPEDISQDFISNNYEYAVNNTFSSVRENILNWYPFKKNCNILEIGAGMGSITGLLCDKAKEVTAVEMNSLRAEVIKTRFSKRRNLKVISQNIEYIEKNNKYDYVIMIGVLEYSEVFFNVKEPFKYLLEIAKNNLKENGVILCAIENRFGLKYWCGAAEDHLQKPFIGINGYNNERMPKTFSKRELSDLFTNAGFNEKRFYYILPDYRFPRIIFTDEYLPKTQDIENIPLTYSKGSLLHSKEQSLYNEIIKNNLIDFFANSYLIEASPGKLNKYKINYVSARGEVKKEYRCNTIINNENKAIKYSTHNKSRELIKRIYNNYLYLKKRKIKQIEQYYRNNEVWSRIVNYKRADLFFQEALASNNMMFLYKIIDLLKINIKKSSDVETKENILIDLGYINKENFNGTVLKNGFIDMTFYNAFYYNNELIFFDQEWKFNNIPIEFILYYAIKIAYNRAKVKTDIKIEDLFNYAGIYDNYHIYDKLESYIWSTVLYRSGDLYGIDGYCNQYNENLTYEKYIEINNKIIYENQLLKEEEIKNIEFIKNINIELNNNKKHIEQLLEIERVLNRKIVDIQDIVIKKDEYIIEKENEIINLINICNNQKIEKDNLILERERFLNSRSWRITKPLRSFANFIKRNRILYLFAKVILSIKKYGIKTTIEKINSKISKSRQINRQKKIKINNNHFKYKIQVFQLNKKPVVSIIIPVYNQFNYTYNCLNSILKYSNDIKYEIIIADDNSTDKTKKIERIFKNIKVIKTLENVGFLKNCNNAAKYAKGEYLLFLNNDTQVQKNWLSPLVDIMKKDTTIGLAGSKLVYSNGKLQEAGGILWQDASAWNYGNGNDPTLPEYNYVKEADYISGASILVRRTLWEQLGGFDELFCPAYCEDSDLAFRIREAGYRIIYQPASVVVHFEGKTNGNDINQGLKKYQVINQKKFYNKWQIKLKDENFLSGENIFLARDRSKNKKTLLMIDHYVPHYDKDAGSRTIYQYLKFFVRLGYNVKFIGDNFYQHQPYVSTLEQIGIEVLYGKYYAENWIMWLKENGKYINYVFLNRPHISIKYIDEVRKYTNAKIAYYGHDLHFLRELRECEVKNDFSNMNEIEYRKTMELSIINKADISFYPSEVEINYIKKIDNTINVKVIPAYIYEKQIEKIRVIKKTNDIMFVGGFIHTPNIDGIKWFVKEIFPVILKQKSDIKLYILGSNPPEEIKKLDSKNIVIKGYVTDEQLEYFYENCRISIVPLRYGAGIKGKVIEAFCKQIPVITTSIGAEGIATAENCLFIKDDPIEFANEVLRIYDKDELLQNKIKNGIDVINNYFTEEAAKKALNKDFIIDLIN